VVFGLEYLGQLPAQALHLSRVEPAAKYGVLHPLTCPLQDLSGAAEPGRVPDIITHQPPFGITHSPDSSLPVPRLLDLESSTLSGASSGRRVRARRSIPSPVTGPPARSSWHTIVNSRRPGASRSRRDATRTGR